MRVLFVGSKNMGVAALDFLASLNEQGLINLCGVVARWDDDQTFWYESVSQRARELGLKVLMPEKLKDTVFLESIAHLQPDVGFCCFYPNLFPDPLFSLPKHGFYNLHFAPLPKYRGALPIPYAILNGEKEHGVTMHLMEKGADTGPILSQALLPIYEDDAGLDLYHRCEEYGINLFEQTVNLFVQAQGKCRLRPQNHAAAISHKRADLKSLEVSFAWGLEKVRRFVRAFDFPPFPLPFVFIEGKKYLLTVAPEKHGFASSQVNLLANTGEKLYLVETDETTIR